MDAGYAVSTRARLAEAQATVSAGLRGLKLVLARLTWLALVGLSLGVFLVTTSARYVHLLGIASQNAPALARLNLTWEFLAAYLVVLDYLTVFAFTAIGLVIFFRKSNDPLAMFVSLVLVLLGTTIVRPADAVRLVEPMFRAPMLLTYPLAATVVLTFLFIFPDGSFVPSWSRWVALVTSGALFVWYLLPAIRENPMPWPPPGFPGFYFAAVVVGVLAQIYRYRRCATASQQQQTKWVVYGLTAALTGLIGFVVVVPALNPQVLRLGIERLSYILVGVPLFYLLMVTLPLSMAFSILRYRLYEIDLIINRTLVYVPLTAILAGLFAASISLSQRIFLALTGERSDAATVLTTLIVVAAFDPIKSSLQRLVDRRFKEVPDPAKKLNAFGERVETVVQVINAEQLTHRLLVEAASAFGAESGAVYMTRQGKLELAQTFGTWNGKAQLIVPIARSDGAPVVGAGAKDEDASAREARDDSTYFGVIALGPRRDGQDYAPQDGAALELNADRVARAIEALSELKYPTMPREQNDSRVEERG